MVERIRDDDTPTAEDLTLVESVRRQVEQARARLGPQPERLGSYRILGVLGQGGMGIVYKAQQDHPLRIVALKVLRPSIVSNTMLRRFDKEVQAMGRLHHVGIAQIYEGGSSDGGGELQHFFAMEYVEGLPLTDYCDAKKLSTSERLALLAKVCDAIDHAHCRNVIHRDLKPSNILVDRAGQPKVLDFGVARVTDLDIHVVTHRTEARKLIGTLPYMSPEQVRGNHHEVDPRSDVYALGVLGYRMLTGRYPFHIPESSLPEAARIIQEVDPSPLRFLDRSLRGDIETIVFKALEKKRRRRYQTAAELAADIRRHLGAEPIQARPPSRFYRLQKFTRRNKAFVIGAVSIIAALTLGLAASMRAFQLAEQQVAEFRRLRSARDLVEYRQKADMLWPPYPHQIPALKAWLKEVGALQAQLSEHRAKRRAMLEQSYGFANPEGQADRVTLRQEEELFESRDALRLANEALSRAQASGDEERIAVLQSRIRHLQSDISFLTQLTRPLQKAEFEDKALGLQYDVISALIHDLETFLNPISGDVASVRRRLDIARNIARHSIDDHKEAWQETIDAVGDEKRNPHYGGLIIEPQVGLVPLGKDPASGLFEFAHLLTGSVPERGPGGSLQITESTGTQ